MGRPVPADDLPLTVPAEDLPETVYTNPLKPFQQGLYGGLADVLGAPVDLASIITGEKAPLGGSESIRRGMRSIPLPSGSKLTYENIGEVPPEWRPLARAGEVFGGAGPIGAAPFLVRRAARELPRVIRPMVEAARARPGQFLAQEAAATAGGAQGAIVAEMIAPGEPIPRFVGEIGGALVNPIGFMLRGVTRGITEAKTAIQGMTAAGRRSKAAELLQEALEKAGEDPAALAKRLREIELPGVSLTAGQKVSSPTLLAFEAKIATQTPEFGTLAKTRALESFSALRRLISQMEASGDPELLKTAARIRQSYFTDLISSRLGIAQRQVQKTLDVFAGDKQQASMRAMNQLDDALSDARKAETALWEQVPKNINLAPENILQRHAAIRTQMLPEEPLPPAFIESFVERISKAGSVSSGELQRFRSQMLLRAREARSQGKWNEARQYSEMAEGALADMEKIPGDLAERARDWSRGLHDAFSRTFAGETMAVKETGAARIAPELMFERAFGAGGATADVRFRQLQKAVQFPGTQPGILSEQEEFIRAAARATTDPQTGRVNADALSRFLRTNEPLLERFPQVKRDLSDAVTAERTFREVETATGQASKAIAQRSAFAKVLETESPAEAVGAAVRSKTPIQDYLALIRLAKRGPIGATEGLKASTLDYLARQATDATGQFSFARYKQLFNRGITPRGPSFAQLMDANGVMTRNEAARLNEILRRAESIDNALKSGAKIGELIDTPDALFDLVVRITGANIGGAAAVGQVSGAPIVAAGAGSRFMRGLLEKIPRTRIMDVLQEAAKDPKLMANLLEKPRTAKRARELYLQINAAIIQAGLTGDEPSGRMQQIPQ